MSWLRHTLGASQRPYTRTTVAMTQRYLSWHTVTPLSLLLYLALLPAMIAGTPSSLLALAPAQAFVDGYHITDSDISELPAPTPSQSQPSASADRPDSMQRPKTALASAGAIAKPSVSSAKPAQTATIHTTGCTSNGYTEPAALTLSTQPEGLTKVIDTPTYYQISGGSVQDLRTSIETCTARKAVGNFHAVTTYQLNWSYGIAADANGCSLTSVRVGLHVNQFMPLFVPSSTTPSVTQSTWSNYANSLQTHEDGHTAIDTRYAEQLVAALQNLRNIPCNTLDSQAKTTVQSYVTMLNAANELYDSQTGHGTTQGAVL